MTQDKQEQLIRELVVESTEALDQFEQDLLSMEKNEADPDTPHRIFRLIHSLKGTSGCLALHKLEQLAHAGENVLSLLREGTVRADKDLVNRLFAFSDELRKTLSRVSETGQEGADDHAALIADLDALYRNATSAQGSVDTNATSGLFA